MGCAMFSDMAMWIVPGHNAEGSSVPVPEMGEVRFSNGAGGSKRWIYTACVNCNGRPTDEPFHLVSEARNGQTMVILYNPSADQWEWWLQQPGVGQQPKIVDALSDAGLTAGSRVDVGGETTHWVFDIGATFFSNVQVRVAASTSNLATATWKKLKYNSPTTIKQPVYPPGDDGKGRFGVYYEAQKKGGLVLLWSDHHQHFGFPGSENACGQDPAP